MIKIKAVREKDRDFLLKLKNDPIAIKYSFKPHKISKSEHEEWFRRIINSDNVKQFIATNLRNMPIGQTRFDINSRNNSAEIGVSIVPELRGRGYGSKVMRKSSIYAIKNFNIDKVYARVKKGNKASVNAFSKAGFKEISRKKHILMVFTK